MRRHLLFVLLLVFLSLAQFPTCTSQLHAYYQSLGMPAAVPAQPVVLITQLGAGVGIEIEFAFESVSRLYQSDTPALGGSRSPIINYVSFDYPWCVVSVDVLCGGALLTNLPKTAFCPIIDYDIHDDPKAGRMFVYNSEATENTTLPPGCTGNIRVRLNGDIVVTNVGGGNALSDIYSYSFVGLPIDSQNFTLSEAIDDYQHSLCQLTSGDGVPPNFDDQIQTQLVCTDTALACSVVPRPGTHEEVLTPIPTYACRGNLTPGGPIVMIWQVSVYGIHNAPTNTVLYGIHFCAIRDLACQQIITPEDQMGFSGTRRQFISPFLDFNNIEVLTFEGNTSFTQPHYDLANNDIFVRDLPCICGFSIDCLPNGTIDLSPVSKNLKPDNAFPVANASSNISIIVGQHTILLQGNGSFDPDQGPNILSFFWKIYNTTPSPVTIDDPTAENILVTANFVVGQYAFIVYVSDGQDVSFDIVAIEVSLNLIHVILPPDFTVQLIPQTVCPPAGELPPLSQMTPLNGSLTFGENPFLPLIYSWNQTAGSNITIPFTCDNSSVAFLGVEAFIDTDQAIAYVMFPVQGVYTFRLTVTDSEHSTVSYEEISISVEIDFVPPNSTNQNFTSFPSAPVRNNTAPEVPTISFPPPPTIGTTSPIAPFAVPPISPSIPTSPPGTGAPTLPVPQPFFTGLFPELPPPTAVEQALILFAFVATILLWILLFGYLLVQINYEAYAQFDIIPSYPYFY
jgi:hypothetical protein